MYAKRREKSAHPAKIGCGNGAWKGFRVQGSGCRVEDIWLRVQS